MWPGCKMFLLNPVFLSRGTQAKGGSIPCDSWKSITQYVLAVLIVYYIYVEREMKAFLLDDYYSCG